MTLVKLVHKCQVSNDVQWHSYGIHLKLVFHTPMGFAKNTQRNGSTAKKMVTLTLLTLKLSKTYQSNPINLRPTTTFFIFASTSVESHEAISRFKRFGSEAKTSPPVQPAIRSFRVTSRTWPEERTPNLKVELRSSKKKPISNAKKEKPQCFCLVGGWTTHLKKYARQIGSSLPRDRDEK